MKIWMKAKKSEKNMVWVDMEMTGLDPEKEVVLEIATVITDAYLRIIAEGPNLVIHQPAAKLRAMDAWNRNQHGKSGLSEAVGKSKMTAAKAEKETLAFIKKFCPPKKSPLCGNSVHHDRKFLAKYMPSIHRYLHYRIVDVSTLKTLINAWYPRGPKFSKKTETHRALADIRESIEELRFYRQHYFR